uniref:C2H2-type domain-containing protein n=1 Tax=Jaculus jaculus TaxID=51337 RepID=A0A8C5L8M0_JACJA
QLDAVCVKVTSGDKRGKERPVPPRATMQPPTERQSQPCGRGSSLVRLCVTRPQLHKAPSPGTESQPCFLRASPQPRAPQVSVHRPLPALQPVPAKRGKGPHAENGQGTAWAPLAASAAPVTAPDLSGSAHVFISSLHTMHTEKLKKSLKVKTRSGRVSRPPRYKAKDYKFIKTEDLADGHLSDSEDYSELSVEEEEEQREKQVLFHVEECALRPKAFKCQACEKSYIGKGGLARHFKLNPGHGQLEPEMLAPGYMEARTRGLAALQPSIPAASRRKETQSARSGLQNGHSVEVEETILPEPDDGSPSVPLESERCLEPRSGEPETVAESSPASPQQSGAAQPPQGPARPTVSWSRAQLKESLQHCGREDLLELALPQLAQVVTLYEFLLVKVEKGHRAGAQPFFPAVYKEFEELHRMVKKLWQGYLRRSGPCSQEPLEVNNDKVAESLGITEFLRKKELPSQETDGEKPEAAGGQKRGREPGRLATVKKPRGAALPTDTPTCLAATSGCQEKPRPSCAPAASKGKACASGNFPPHFGGSCGEMTSARDISTLPGEQQLSTAASADFAARSGFVDPAPLCLHVSEPVPYAQLAELRESPPCQVSMSPEEDLPELAADQAAGTSQRVQGVCGVPPLSGGGVESLLPGRFGSAETEDLSEMSCFCLDGQQPSPSHVLLPEVTAPPLQNILPMNTVPAACASKMVPKLSPQPGSHRLLSTKEGLSLRSQAGDLNQFPCKVEVQGGQRELESAATAGEALAFEISNRCQEALQRQEQSLIQTSNGLTLSPAGPTMSQEEGVVVTSAGSSALGFSSPAVALQAMEAFLTGEAEPTQ